jgi:hypothetical protein
MLARIARTITMRRCSSSVLSALPLVLLLAGSAGAQEAPSCASWPAAAKYAARVSDIFAFGAITAISGPESLDLKSLDSCPRKMAGQISLAGAWPSLQREGVAWL